MAKDIDGIKTKIQKLLAQAQDRAGTPEGDAFQEKAFALLASYGLKESDIKDAEHNPSDILREIVHLHGRYIPLQKYLLTKISRALHCRVVFTDKTGFLFGARRHIERVMMLFPMLNNIMAAGATKQKADALSALNTTQLRRSYMYGFSNGVEIRLAKADKDVAKESGVGTEIMLADDELRAKAALNKAFPRVKATRRTAALSATALEAGMAEARKLDLDQKLSSRRAALTR